jgi:hypothetical protein
VKKKGYIKSERRPKDIPKFLHEYMNKQFIKVAGWPVRNGVSTTPSTWQASSYGRPMLFFPIGKLRWAYMGNDDHRIYDLYAELNSQLKGFAEDKMISLHGSPEGKELKKKKNQAAIDYMHGKITQKEFEEIDKNNSHQIWQELSYQTIRKWTEDHMNLDKGLWKIVDDLVEKSVILNKSWKNHDGEVMFNVNEYYLFNFESNSPADVIILFQKLGIKHYDQMPGVEYR